MHAAVVTGVLPLATARWRRAGAAAAAVGRLLGVRAGRLRAGAGFAAWQGSGALSGRWLAAAGGAVGGHRLRGRGAGRGQRAGAAGDLLGAGAVAAADAAGACWWLRPVAPASVAAWGALLYVSLFSMWLGFFAWYRGLALGGVVRVSQVQLLQPFLALLFAVPVLGETLEPATVVFALAGDGGGVCRPAHAGGGARMTAMRCLGLLGGMSWESTAVLPPAQPGRGAAPGRPAQRPLLLHSVDFAPHGRDAGRGRLGRRRVAAGRRRARPARGRRRWPGAGHQHHAQGGRRHRAAAGLPLLHIADATGAAIAAAGTGARRRCWARASPWKMPPSCSSA